MNRRIMHLELAALVALCPLAIAACSSGDARAKETPAPAPVAVSAAAAVEQPIVRFIRATGTLTAEEQADVAAETAGRVVSTPVERGSRVTPGAELVRVLGTETSAQLKEAEANAAQIEARLGLTGDGPFASASFTLPCSCATPCRKCGRQRPPTIWRRVSSAASSRCSSSASCRSRSTTSAAQQYQSLQAARARVALAHKASTDTVVRAPFAGVVEERLVSVGDYVTKGMKVAVVVRVNPLRLQLTVPEQFVSVVSVGMPVTFDVDAYPGRHFEGRIKYVSPALQADRRALPIEAVVPNPGGELKPGFFATARIEQPTRTPAIVVPASAVQTSGGTSHVYVIAGDKVEDRIVTIGQTTGELVEITKGIKAGERVATSNLAQLADGTRIKS